MVGCGITLRTNFRLLSINSHHCLGAMASAARVRPSHLSRHGFNGASTAAQRVRIHDSSSASTAAQRVRAPDVFEEIPRPGRVRGNAPPEILRGWGGGLGAAINVVHLHRSIPSSGGGLMSWPHPARGAPLALVRLTLSLVRSTRPAVQSLPLLRCLRCAGKRCRGCLARLLMQQ